MRAAEFMRAIADMLSAIEDDKPAQAPVVVNVNTGASNNTQRTPSIDAEQKDLNPIMVPPLQQHIELAKANQGKDSQVIQKLTRSEH
jgi:hypothetical protein